MPTIVTTNCLNTSLSTKQDKLKKCDGSPLLADTTIPTCTEFNTVSNSLSSVSSALTNTSNSLSSVSSALTNTSNSLSSVSSVLTNTSNNLASVSAALGGAASGGSVTLVSNNLQAVSSTLNNVSSTVQNIENILNNKGTAQDIVDGTDDTKIISAKDINEAFTTFKTIPIKLMKKPNNLAIEVRIEAGTTTSDNVFIRAEDLPNTQSSTVTTSFYTNYTGVTKSFDYDISGANFGIGINDDGTAKSINITGLYGLAIGSQSIISNKVIGAGRSAAHRGLNYGENTTESYGGYYECVGKKTSGKNMGVYAQVSNAPMNTGIVSVTTASTADTNYRTSGRQTGIASYAEGSSTLNYAVESYATATSAGTNHGVFGYATNGFNNKGIEGFAVGATAGTNYGGRFVAQNASSNNWAIDCIGDGNLSGTMYAQAFTTTSDRNLKKDFKPVKNILAVKIQQFTKSLVQPIFEQIEKEEVIDAITFENGKEGTKPIKRKTFSLKQKLDKDDKPVFDMSKASVEIGVLAQDIQAIYPEFVKKDERGYLTIDFNSVQFAFIESLRQEIIKLQTRVTALEAKNIQPTTATTSTKATTAAKATTTSKTV